MSDTIETPKAEPTKPDYSLIYAALAAAQGAFPIIPRDKTVKVTMKSGGTYTFAYAPLDTILAAVRPHLAANGLAVMQTMESDHVWTIITHASGVQIKLAPVKVLQTESGPQALGSALTYARRYSVTLALNLAADEDDDANGAQGNKAEKQNKGAGQQQASKAATATSSDLTEDQVKYFPRVKAALDTLFGSDVAAKKKEIAALTEFKGKDDKMVSGVEDYRKLDGKRLQILAQKLEQTVAQSQKNAQPE